MKRKISNLNGKITFVNDDPKNHSPNLPVSEHLANLIEDVVNKTNLSINVNSTTGGSHSKKSFHYHGMAIDINLINDKKIDDPGNLSNVRTFQQIVSQHPDVAECFDPLINIRKRGAQVAQMPHVKIKHLNHLHISSQR